MTDGAHPEKGPKLITNSVEKGTQFFLISKNISNVTNIQYKKIFSHEQIGKIEYIIFKCVEAVNRNINYGLVPKYSTTMHPGQKLTIFFNICGALIIVLKM